MTVNREALENLKRVLSSAPDTLNMSRFRETCGTAACAIGHAVEDPWFQENRLQLSDDGTVVVFRDRKEKRIHRGEKATLKFFGLSDADNKALFYPGTAMATTNPVAKQDVIANIDLILEGQPAMAY